MMTYNNTTNMSHTYNGLDHNGLDYNDAKPQGVFDVIPKGTVARVIMTIRPGGYDDPQRNYTGGWATLNPNTGSIYLSCEYSVLEQGEYYGQRIWGFIGLHSPKSDVWATMGRSMIRGILDSARGFSSKDESIGAKAARKIKGFGDLNGIEFVARIDVEKDKDTDELRNVIKAAVTKDQKDYAGHDSGYYAGTSSSTASWAR
ncbi:hypothetical protein [Candidatus Finniella inopinata]|uniref:DUF669 domain-containing protein n=1 Tax=Candidatus Finniella inopinata TaxID=1696036 RepID=A0A4Q7DIK6_9PROT|nr:hypothetical protein [Candidatus Finniella inopinata]RZI46653.1 hypothetical protein EQU50_03455 [Candidatus Finniella inopinata]